MMIYGLSTCSLCRAAVKAIEAEGHEVAFRDIRSDPLTEAELAELIAEFGHRLVDRTSHDWRGLSMWLKESEAEAQIAAQPKVMTRPVIRDGDRWFLGWDDTVRAELLPT